MGASESGDPLEPLDEDTFAPDDDLPDVDLPDLDAVGEIDGLGDDEVIPRDDLSGDSAGMDEPSPAPDFAEDDFWVGPRTETQPPSSSDPLPDDLEEGQSLGDELVDLDGDDFKIEDSGILGDDLPDDETSSDDEDGSHSP